MSLVDIFGGQNISPVYVSYSALSLSSDTPLYWPEAGLADVALATNTIDVAPAGVFTITMPDATVASTGRAVLFNNVGAYNVVVQRSGGGVICTLLPGTMWYAYLTDNSTVAGTWRSVQYGAATSEANSADLAGYGLVAIGPTLAQSQPLTPFNSNFTLTDADRAAGYVWTGGVGVLSLPAAGAVGNNWFFSTRNGGTGNLTLDPVGSDLINESSTLVLRPGDSAVVVTDGTDWFTIGLGQDPVFAFDFTSIDLTGEASPYTLEGAETNRIAYQFVGVQTTDMLIVIPPTTQQYWIANDTTGGSYTLSVGTATQGSPLFVTRGARGIYYCQGSDLVKADTASIALPIAISDGGTGATNASGARINLGGTSTGISLFTAASASAARTTLEASTVGANVFTSTDAAAARGFLGSTTVGDALFITASASAGRTTLGAAASGANTDITSMNPAGGMAFGSATGGAQGAGTVNATGLFINGVAVGTGSGSVTSVQASGGTTGLSFAGGPITTSGTLTLSGTLVVANGGTGQTSYTDGQLLIGNSSGNGLTKATITAGANVTVTNGNGTITIAATAGGSGTVTSVGASGGTTGLSFSGSPVTTSGTLTLAGTLGLANGGTGATTLSGMLKGNGTSAISSATAGTDYVAPTVATSFSGKQTFVGASSVLSSHFYNASEQTTVSATAATGTVNYDLTTQSILYYTTNASANWTVNIRASSGTSLNSAMGTGHTITCAFLVKQGGTAYYNSAVQVDGTTSGVTTVWQGGTAPSAGHINSIDVYTYSVIKTGSATFTVLASVTQFA